MTRNRNGAERAKPRRRQKVLIPPPGPQASAGDYEFIVPNDLSDAAREAGLPVRADDLPRLAGGVNKALNDFCLWAAVDDRNSSPARKADWCYGVANHARALLIAMGWGMAPLLDGQPFRDAMLHLGAGFPVELSHRHELDRLIPSGPPATWNEGLQEGKDETDRLHEGWWKLAEQLRPSLVALIGMAERADATWSGEISQGGSTPDEALRKLFHRLGLAFTALTGKAPTVNYRDGGPSEGRHHAPEGPALDWHLAILRAAALGANRRHGIDSPHVPAETQPGAARLAALASHFGQHRDGLAKRINEAPRAVALESHFAELQSEPD